METLSQSDLVDRLTAIFPTFAAEWQADAEDSSALSDSLHSVYLSFLPFVSGVVATTAQLGSLAALLSQEVAAGGDRENAVATCFLEHCGQVGLHKELRPLLSNEARTRLHA